MYKPEVILVTLTNGDVALFVNSDAVMTLEASEKGSDPTVVAEYLAKSLGVGLQSVTMDQPQDEERSWNDVYALVLRAPVADSSLPIDDICNRLLDSEEHATESAIPQVAEDAVVILRELNAELGRLEAANQNLVSERDEALKFVGQVANLDIWDYGDTTECERPSEGFLDSHCCLMDLIQDARGIQEGK